jgi:hypothetical protein
VSDDRIGSVIGDLAKARASGSDRQQLPVVSRKSGKQHGLVSVSLRFEPQVKAPAAAAPAAQPAQAVAPQQPPVTVVYAGPPPAMSAPSYSYPAPPPPAYYPAPQYGYAAAPPPPYGQPSYAYGWR